ncbi:MAG: hypothetical protein IKO93_19675 [Lentisphaeria bacterium]|nr:hypothetical protein [Lentisphaeria bacterium]
MNSDANLNPFLKTLTRSNSDQKLAGRHPLLQLTPDQSVRISYFQGIVLAALIDDGIISDGEQEHLRTLGISLALSGSDVDDCMATVRSNRSDSDRLDLLTEIADALSDKQAALMFLCEFIRIACVPGHDPQDVPAYIDAFAEKLGLTQARKFFQAFYAFAQPESGNSPALAADVRRKCPNGFLPFLPYFLSEPEIRDQDGLIEELDSLLKEELSRAEEEQTEEKPAKAAPAKKAEGPLSPLLKVMLASTGNPLFLPELLKKAGPAKKPEQAAAEPSFQNVLAQFLKRHPEISEYQLMQMLLPAVKQKFVTLKRAIDREEGTADHSRYYLDLESLPSYTAFLNYVCLMDLLTVCDSRFLMVNAVEPPKDITWTQVREPREDAVAEAKEIFGVYVKELENRCKR